MKKLLAVGSASIITLAILSCRGGAPSASAEPPINSAASNSPTGSDSKTVQFSGYTWLVKSSDRRVGPGPNHFSASADNVTVDAQGHLHLRITQRDGLWSCAEVINKESLGYGTYRFYLNTSPESLDPQVILGLFTWHDDPAYGHREIDIEVSRWGRANNKNAQFVVQPYTNLNNMVRFQIPPDLSSSTHSFTWKADSIFFQSIKGSDAASPESNDVILQRTFTKNIPKPGGENPRINLWLMSGRAPANGKEAEVIISKFEYIPLQR